MESRFGNRLGAGARQKSSPLPDDFLRMVEQVFSTHFDAGLKEIARHREKPEFRASGAIFPDEVILAVSLGHKNDIVATTVHTSTDFDPKASSPTAQDLLAACVDAAGAVFGRILDPANPERIEQVAADSLAAFEDVPFEWAQVEIDRFRIHVKVDKANPSLDQMADEWLASHDPDLETREKREEEETKKLFVTGDKAKRGVTGDPSRSSLSDDDAEETGEDEDEDEDEPPTFH